MSKQFPSTVDILTRVGFINQALVALDEYFDIYSSTQTTTVAGVDEYELPAAISDFSQIVSLGIAKQKPPDDRYDFLKYRQGKTFDYPKNGRTYYPSYNSHGDKMFVIYPVPQETGLMINIIYKTRFAMMDWASNDVEPQLDSRYHILLVYYACHMVASMGHGPDTLQADMFMQKWLDGIKSLQRDQLRERLKNPNRHRDNPHWHKGKQHSAGTQIIV